MTLLWIVFIAFVNIYHRVSHNLVRSTLAFRTSLALNWLQFKS